MVAKNLRLIVACCFIVTGCQSIPVSDDATLQRPNEPREAANTSSTDSRTVPVTANETAPSTASKTEPTPSGSDNKTKSAEPEPSAAQVVTRLQLEALQLQSEGKWSEAELKLERALRIDTDKVDLYHQMATVRMGQERFAEAEQIALKGLTLTDQTPKYKASLWEVIAQCRSAQGDISGARSARNEMLKWMASE